MRKGAWTYTYIRSERNDPDNEVDPQPIDGGEAVDIAQVFFQTMYIRLDERSAGYVDHDQADQQPTKLLKIHVNAL